MTGEHDRAPSAIVHMSISGNPSVAQVVADTVGQSFGLTTAPPPVTAGDYATPARNGPTMRLLRLLLRRELRTMRERHGIVFDA